MDVAVEQPSQNFAIWTEKLFSSEASMKMENGAGHTFPLPNVPSGFLKSAKRYSKWMTDQYGAPIHSVSGSTLIFDREAAGMNQPIIDYHQDEHGDWVADLACGHGQHVRHQPPFFSRPWVLTSEGRAHHLGHVLACKKCDEGEPITR